MQAKPQNIDAYIADFPEDVQERMQQLRLLISKMVPSAEEAIKYNMPTFVWKGNLLHFAAYKEHIGLYPAPIADNEAFKDDLKEYKTGKGSIQFPNNKPLPIDLIKKIIKWRVNIVQGK